MKLLAFCDGGARGNPGPAGLGVVIKDASGKVVAEISEAIGHATNNVAEYSAVKRALERARELGATEVEIVSDSKLLVEQLNGRFKVKNPTLQRFHAEVRAVARGFTSVTYRHVRREYNVRADELVNLAIDAWLQAGGEEASPREPGQKPLF